MTTPRVAEATRDLRRLLTTTATSPLDDEDLDQVSDAVSRLRMARAMAAYATPVTGHGQKHDAKRHLTSLDPEPDSEPEPEGERGSQLWAGAWAALALVGVCLLLWAALLAGAWALVEVLS